MIEGLLEGLEALLGPARIRGGSAAAQVAGLGPPALPAGWSSPATQPLVNHHGGLDSAGEVFAAGDDETKTQVDSAAGAVRDGKNQMSAIKDDYHRNRDRLAPAASNPEVSARMAELDRQRAADGANTIRATLSRLPSAGAGRAALAPMLAQMMPAASAPANAIMPALGAPVRMLQALPGLTAPAVGMLGGLTVPHTTSHTGTPPHQPNTINAASRVAGADLPPGVASEKGLQKDTILAARAVSAAFPEIATIGGYRPDSLPWHPNGQAIDVMIPDPMSPHGKSLGDQVLQFALQHTNAFHINHVIWQQRMYNADGTSVLMHDRGSPTQNHMDHVHIATNGGGYPHSGEVYSL